MLRYTDSVVCPQCGSDMNTYSDYKSHDYVLGQCLFCGFYYDTVEGYNTLSAVNKLREDVGYGKIKKLIKVKEGIGKHR